MVSDVGPGEVANQGARLGGVEAERNHGRQMGAERCDRFQGPIGASLYQLGATIPALRVRRLLRGEALWRQMATGLYLAAFCEA